MNNINKKSGFAYLPISLIAIVLAVIGVGGYLVTKSAQPIPPVPTNETSDWKTYRNERYEFEVKYPKKWLVTKKGKTTSITDPTTKIPWLESSIPQGIIIYLSSTIIKKMPDSNIQIGSRNASVFDWSGGSKTIYFPNMEGSEGLIIDLRANSTSRELLDQVFSTFKFTN